MKKRTIFATLLLSTILLSACQTNQKTTESTHQSSVTSKQSTQPSTQSSQSTTTSTTVEQATPNNASIVNQLIALTDQASPGANQNYYFEAGEAQLTNDDDLQNGQLSFQADAQGRSGIARGKLTYSLFEQSKGSRQGTPLDPPHWPQNKRAAIHYQLTNRIYHGYFYNRSHSIADSLGGEQTYQSAYNFTTGTRPQNVGANQNGGMRAAEETVENYWRQHPNTTTIVHYQVTPVYKAYETMPHGSIVDMKSDDGTINKRIGVINDAEGYRIDYQNGQFEEVG